VGKAIFPVSFTLVPPSWALIRIELGIATTGGAGAGGLSTWFSADPIEPGRAMSANTVIPVARSIAAGWSVGVSGSGA
jgi:hypothetical protein